MNKVLLFFILVTFFCSLFNKVFAKNDIEKSSLYSSKVILLAAKSGKSRSQKYKTNYSKTKSSKEQTQREIDIQMSEYLRFSSAVSEPPLIRSIKTLHHSYFDKPNTELKKAANLFINNLFPENSGRLRYLKRFRKQLSEELIKCIALIATVALNDSLNAHGCKRQKKVNKSKDRESNIEIDERVEFSISMLEVFIGIKGPQVGTCISEREMGGECLDKNTVIILFKCINWAWRNNNLNRCPVKKYEEELQRRDDPFEYRRSIRALNSMINEEIKAFEGMLDKNNFVEFDFDLRMPKLTAQNILNYFEFKFFEFDIISINTKKIINDINKAEERKKIIN